MYQVINVYMIGPGICGVIKMTDCVPTVNARDGKTKMKEKKRFFFMKYKTLVFFWFKRGLDQGPEQRESKLTVLCLLIIIILISYIIIYYIIIKLLITENHPSRNRKRNSQNTFLNLVAICPFL
jgi:hypothetical protein